MILLLIELYSNKCLSPLRISSYMKPLTDKMQLNCMAAPKKPLTTCQFSVLFDDGKEKSCYWGYRQAWSLYGYFPFSDAVGNYTFAIDFVFELDFVLHSKQRTVHRLGFGCEQRRIRDTEIADAATELDDCACSIAMWQAMIYMMLRAGTFSAIRKQS